MNFTGIKVSTKLETVFFWKRHFHESLCFKFLCGASLKFTRLKTKIGKCFVYAEWPTKMSLFFFGKTFAKIRKPARFFLHSYWKFIGFF